MSYTPHFNLYFTQFFRSKMMYFVVVNSADKIDNEINRKHENVSVI